VNVQHPEATVPPSRDESVATVLPPVPPSVASARRFVAAALRRHHTIPDVIDTACLLTSELVTNALVHARSRVKLTVSVTGRRIRVEVGDASDAQPRPRPMADDATTGRGLHIVDAMATRWGSSSTADGKRVWFELDGADG
jgi:anti-sigma regulatory factor (Ser/Thr protein kinase)